MSSAEARIRSEIRRDGIISFARFMELALYSPKTGYYETHAETIGRRGDYFTSVSVGPVFGDCLALTLGLGWALNRPSSEPWCIVEAGAHQGRMAADILNALQRRFPNLYARLRYQIVEPSSTRRTWQGETLSDHRAHVQWVDSVDQLDRFSGVFLCNELFDAFPVHRFEWSVTRREWREQGVSESGDGFAWGHLASPTIDFQDVVASSGLILPDYLLAVLPDGFVLELCPSAQRYWSEMATHLENGWMMTIDYGLGLEEWIRPERCSGTARAYHHHKVSADLLAQPGAQDITAHVNFGALERMGAKAGLLTRSWQRQGSFLASIARDAVAAGIDLGWNAVEMRQFQTLTHPQHLGHSFRVLVQQTRNAY